MKTNELKTSVAITLKNQFSTEDAVSIICEDLNLSAKYFKKKLRDKYNELLLAFHNKEVSIDLFTEKYVSFIKEIVIKKGKN